jgi:AcrR family transcriptional regulator
MMTPTEHDLELYRELLGPKGRRSDVRKLRIIQAVIDSIARGGLANTTFESIGKRVGMRAPHVAYYFTTRDELIEAAVRYVWLTAQEITRGELARATSPREKIEATFAAAFKHLTLHPKHGAVIVVFYHLCTYQETFRALHTALRQIGVERLAPSLFQYAGGKLSEATCLGLAHQGQVIFFGYLLEILTTHSRLAGEQGKERVVSALFSLIDRELRGVA